MSYLVTERGQGKRRYTQALRERQDYDFLRRYAELKTKIERATNDGPG